MLFNSEDEIHNFLSLEAYFDILIAFEALFMVFKTLWSQMRILGFWKLEFFYVLVWFKRFSSGRFFLWKFVLIIGAVQKRRQNNSVRRVSKKHLGTVFSRIYWVDRAQQKTIKIL